MASKQWRFLTHDRGRIDKLARESGLPHVVAQLLVSRGLYDRTQVERFLRTKLTDLRDPLELPGVPEASELLWTAATERQKIVVYGDYDADGMTASSILYNGLKLLGAEASYHVPNRLEEGYGLNSDSLRKLAASGKQWVVTVDCGINSIEQAALCRELGMRLVITDHHQISGPLPDAAAIVHPVKPGSVYPFSGLCGAGVAFKLVWALFQKAAGSTKVTDAMRDHLMKSLALAAIGTVADVVPLLDENRALVAHGLKTLKAGSFTGVKELLRVTGLDQKDALSAEDIGFTIAPRLNAAGRLGQAQLGVELLTTQNPQRASALADYLHQLNASRESLERSVYLAAQKQAKEECQPHDDAALVLSGSGWHVGVIGVVAGRLAEKYCRPVIILSTDPLGSKPAIGSARAGCSVNLHEALMECQHLLVACGGHAAAAGLKIESDRINAFRDEFREAVARRVADGGSDPEILIDAEAPLGQLTLETVKQLEQLAPFGNGNPRPVLCASGLELAEPPKKMGNGERHLMARFRQGNVTMRAVAFGQAEWADLLIEQEGSIDVAFRPVINEFRGMRAVEMQIVDWRPARHPAPV